MLPLDTGMCFSFSLCFWVRLSRPEVVSSLSFGDRFQIRLGMPLPILQLWLRTQIPPRALQRFPRRNLTWCGCEPIVRIGEVLGIHEILPTRRRASRHSQAQRSLASIPHHRRFPSFGECTQDSKSIPWLTNIPFFVCLDLGWWSKAFAKPVWFGIAHDANSPPIPDRFRRG